MICLWRYFSFSPLLLKFCLLFPALGLNLGHFGPKSGQGSTGNFRKKRFSPPKASKGGGGCHKQACYMSRPAFIGPRSLKQFRAVGRVLRGGGGRGFNPPLVRNVAFLCPFSLFVWTFLLFSTLSPLHVILRAMLVSSRHVARI